MSAHSPVSIHSFIRRHSQTDDLIFLANQKNRHPHGVKTGVKHHPADPWRAASDNHESSPKSVFNIDNTNVSVVNCTAV